MKHNRENTRSIFNNTLKAKNKSVTSVPIIDFIQHHPRAHFYDILRSPREIEQWKEREKVKNMEKDRDA